MFLIMDIQGWGWVLDFVKEVGREWGVAMWVQVQGGPSPGRRSRRPPSKSSKPSENPIHKSTSQDGGVGTATFAPQEINWW